MSPDKTLSALVEKAKTGDRGALDKLVKHFQPRLLERIHLRMSQYVKLKLDAEDVLQETCRGFIESIEDFQWKGEDSLFALLSKRAENQIRNAVRRKMPQQLALGDEISSSQTSPSKAIRRDDRFGRFEHAFRSLDPDQRLALKMARIDGYKIKEIAQKMNRSLDSVKRLLARALIQLKCNFGDTESLNLPQKQIHIDSEGLDDK